jgi:hypothetical protein
MALGFHHLCVLNGAIAYAQGSISQGAVPAEPQVGHPRGRWGIGLDVTRKGDPGEPGGGDLGIALNIYLQVYESQLGLFIYRYGNSE